MYLLNIELTYSFKNKNKIEKDKYFILGILSISLKKFYFIVLKTNM